LIKGKRRLQLRSIPHHMQKNWWTCVHKQQSSVVSFKFNIALAIYVYDNAVAFGPCDFAAN